MSTQEERRAYADSIATYISIHPDYDHWVKDEAVREAVNVMATDIGAAQGFLDILGVNVDLFASYRADARCLKNDGPHFFGLNGICIYCGELKEKEDGSSEVHSPSQK